MMNTQYHLFQFNLAVSDPFGRLISEDLLPNRGFGVPQSLSKNSSSSMNHLRLNQIASTPRKGSIFNSSTSCFIMKDEETKVTQGEIPIESYSKKNAFQELIKEYHEEKNKEEDGGPKCQLPLLRQQQTEQPSVPWRIECLLIPDRSDSMKELDTIAAGLIPLPSPLRRDGQRGRPPQSSLIGKAFQQKAVLRSMKTLITKDLDIQDNVRRQFNDNLKFDKLLKEFKTCKAKVPNQTSLLFVACYTSSKKQKEAFLRSDYGLIFKIMTPRLRQEYEGKEAIYNQIIDSFNDFAQEHQ